MIARYLLGQDQAKQHRGQRGRWRDAVQHEAVEGPCGVLADRLAEPGEAALDIGPGEIAPGEVEPRAAAAEVDADAAADVVGQRFLAQFFNQ